FSVAVRGVRTQLVTAPGLVAGFVASMSERAAPDAARAPGRRGRAATGLFDSVWNVRAAYERFRVTPERGPPPPRAPAQTPHCLDATRRRRDTPGHRAPSAGADRNLTLQATGEPALAAQM